MAILAKHRALFGSKGHRTMAESDISKVVEAFDEVGADWALVGAHAVGLLTEPRATADFDFIIDASKLKKILQALRDRLGTLDEHDMGAAVRLQAIDVDLIRSTNHPIFARALTLTRRSGAWRIPRPEVLLVLKFLAAVSPWRNDEKRAYDVGDMRSVFRAVGKENLDLPLVLELGALAYPGAEKELSALLEKIERGERIEV